MSVKGALGLFMENNISESYLDLSIHSQNLQHIFNDHKVKYPSYILRPDDTSAPVYIMIA